MKFWNVGNTTVRNPDRIKAGLKVLFDHFEGQVFDEETQERFLYLLVERGIYEKGEKAWSPHTAGMGGRKWASAANQLGLAIAWKSKGAVQLTSAGRALINEEVSEQEVFLRQMLKQHLPSPIEHGKEYAGFDVYPFRLTLRIIYALRERGLKGITKEEIGLFLITTLANKLEQQTIDRILEYRETRDSISGKAAKKEFYRKKKERMILALFSDDLERRFELLETLAEKTRKDMAFLETEEARQMLSAVIALGKGARTTSALTLLHRLVGGLKERLSARELMEHVNQTFIHVRGATPKDYADTTVRYFAKSGLFSLSGDKLIPKETEMPLIEEIIDEGYPEYQDDRYLADFYNVDQPKLPLDDELFLKNGIYELLNARNEVASSLGMKSRSVPALPASIPQLKKLEGAIKQDMVELKEQLFYLNQPNQTSDIIEYFEKISDRSLLGGDAYLPAYYEWTIWRAFLAIDSIENPIPLTRGFKIDEELFPIHHAAAGNADMVFVYKDFVLVVEATLNRGANQWAAEAEPVPRHVAKVVEKYQSLPVYGFFVAPAIDPNTAQTFFHQTYWVGDKLHELEILPVSTEQLVGLISKFAQRPFSVEELRGLLEEMIGLKKGAEHGMQWKNAVDRHLAQWSCVS